MLDTKLQDIPSGRDGQGYIIVNGSIYEAFSVKKITPKAEFTIESQQFLGDRVEDNAIRGVKYSGDLEYYNTTSVLKKAIRTYQNGGSFPDISIQYYSESNTHGREEITLSGIVFDSIPLGGLDDSSEKSSAQATTFKAHHLELTSTFDE